METGTTQARGTSREGATPSEPPDAPGIPPKLLNTGALQMLSRAVASSIDSLRETAARGASEPDELTGWRRRSNMSLTPERLAQFLQP